LKTNNIQWVSSGVQWPSRDWCN